MMRTIVSTAVIAAMLLGSMPAFAVPVSASADSFSITPILPPNQNPDSSGFFDLRVTAGTRHQLGLEVSNMTSDPITVELSLNTVTTNHNGIIDYTAPGTPDESMLHPFAEIASFGIGNEVPIPPHSSVEVPIYVDIPQEGFDGIILGSIGVMLGIGMTDEELRQAGMFVNRFQRVVAVRLQERESTIVPDFALGDVGAELVNFRASIVANIRNPMPLTVMGTVISAQVYSAFVSSSEPTQIVDNMIVDFAPNSFFRLSMANQELQGFYPGVNIVRVQIDYDDKTWEFEHVFEISEAQADELNEAIGIIIDADEANEANESNNAISETYDELLIDSDFIVTLAMALAITIATALVIIVVAYIVANATKNR